LKPSCREKYSEILFEAIWKTLENTNNNEKVKTLVGHLLGLLKTEKNVKKAMEWLENGNIEGKHELEKNQKRDIVVSICGQTWIDESMKDELVNTHIGNDQDSDAKAHLRKCEVARPLEDNKKKWWEYLTTKANIDSVEDYSNVCSAFSIGLSAEMAQSFADSYFQNLPKVFKNHFYGRQFIHLLYPGIRDPSSAVEYLDRAKKIIEENDAKGESKNEFMKVHGATLIDSWERQQEAWKKTDESIWPKD